MKTLNVNTKQLSYPIYFDNSFGSLPRALSAAGLAQAAKAVVITDTNLADIYLADVTGRIKGVINDISTFTFPAGEKSKNLDTVKGVYGFFTEKNLDRKSVVFALGGGVTGDMAGFAAATFMRGVAYAQLPTSLLAQVDSSVGGKTGVDFMGHKNYIGAFHQPSLVYINTKTLNTLPPEQFTSGLGECIKHGLIGRDSDYYKFITDNADAIMAKDDAALMKLIEISCKIKADVVSYDEREHNLREILNFGHTFGHAIESLSGFNELHGHTVAQGIRGALYLSHLLGDVNIDVLQSYDLLLKRFGFPALKVDYTASDVYERMFSDKKARGGQLRLVLINGGGCAYAGANASEEQIMAAIGYILKGCAA